MQIAATDHGDGVRKKVIAGRDLARGRRMNNGGREGGREADGMNGEMKEGGFLEHELFVRMWSDRR